MLSRSTPLSRDIPLIFMMFILGVSPQCLFPDFLRVPLPDDRDRFWITESNFIDNTDIWETQLEIIVEPNIITAKVKYKAQCHDTTGTVSCFQRQVHYKRTCFRHEGGDKYMVQEIDNGRVFYTCMKFQPRNRNVVQVWSGVRREDPVPDLCRDQHLQRDEWPWLAPNIEELSLCPVEGGFDFRTYMYERRQKLCHRNWRPSRLESECVRGEGMILTFPEKACSPFLDHRQELTLQCWASWTEEEYRFIVASEIGRFPQFVLRFPRDIGLHPEFHVMLYFSPVVPLEDNPRGDMDTRLAELKMTRGEGGLCFDESPACQDFAKQGRCSSTSLPEYANHCKHSCGICNLLPSTRPECRFPAEFRQEWNLFESDRQELVRIHGGHLSFSLIGNFICKSKHWEYHHYKMLSFYNNGCRPRYTCIDLEQRDEDTLQFRLAPSSRTDQSFNICDFDDDPPPLGSLVRSVEMKTLLPKAASTAHSCGLEGMAAVNVTLPGGRRCAGTLSDWDSYTCSAGPRLTLSLPGCVHGSDMLQEFTCVSYISMDDGLSFLITTAVDGDRYNCWIVRTYPARMDYKPWREAHMLYRAQCGTEEDRDPAVAHVTETSLYTANEHVSRPCSRDLYTRRAQVSTPKMVEAKEIRAKHIEGKTGSLSACMALSASALTSTALVTLGIIIADNVRLQL